MFTLGGSWSGAVGGKHGELGTAAGGWKRLTGVPIDLGEIRYANVAARWDAGGAS